MSPEIHDSIYDEVGDYNSVQQTLKKSCLFLVLSQRQGFVERPLR